MQRRRYLFGNPSGARKMYLSPQSEAAGSPMPELTRAEKRARQKRTPMRTRRGWLDGASASRRRCKHGRRARTPQR